MVMMIDTLRAEIISIDHRVLSACYLETVIVTNCLSAMSPAVAKPSSAELVLFDIECDSSIY